MQDMLAVVDAAEGGEVAEESALRGGVLLVVLLVACAVAFAVLARDAGVGRPDGPTPAQVTPGPADPGPEARFAARTD
ncbi:hypothetical protein [Actinomadura flavalba]|uniref:hypothetical protein n=1 Tax=Actinomadura flavalba TaxID=1120938 RepID=UPI0012DDA713|nr:hypothetical protein [Actinomadura flavalba]